MKQRKYLSFLILLLLLFSGCSKSLDVFPYNTAKITMTDKAITCAKSSGSDAYYLDKNGTLYSPGANSDASCYVCYRNERKGIVAENVVEFDSLSWGGYYIDKNHDLWMWHWEKLPAFDYTKNKNHQKLLSNIKHAYIEVTSDAKQYLLYEDMQGNLYFVGTYNDQTATLEAPKLLAKNIKLFEQNFWLDADENLGMLEENEEQRAFWDKLLENSSFSKDGISHFVFLKDGLVVLQNETLWFSGDYDRLLTPERDNILSEAKEVQILADNIRSFEANGKTILGLDTDDNAYLWGVFLGNKETERHNAPIWNSYQKELVGSQIKSIGSVFPNMLLLIDELAQPLAYAQGVDGQWLGDSYGEDDVNVGLGCEPIRWTK